MLRGVLALAAGPLVYGLVCVPTNWVVVKLFPAHFDEQWQTRHTGLLVLLVSLTLMFAATSGFVSAMIARHNVMVYAAILCVLQLGIGVAVQRQYWNSLPLWYHLTFFLLLVVGILVGAWLSLLTGRVVA